MSNCKSCKTKIIWMKTVWGKNIPVDWKEEIQGQDFFNDRTMVSHFATCPNADKHRKLITPEEK